MTIEILEGQSDRLYSLVAPLVMDRNVLRQNHHYPFWTSPAHVWFVALNTKKEVMAFFPVEVNARGEAKINNYYIGNAKTAVFEALVQKVVAFCRRKYNLTAVALIQHKELFEAAGFQITKEWRQYAKMEHYSKVVKEKASKSGRKKTAKKSAPKKAKKNTTKTAKKSAPKATKKAGKTTKTAKKSVASTKKTTKTTVKKAAKTTAKKTAKKAGSRK